MSGIVRSLWFWPVVVAVAMVIGLVSALLGDGVWDGLSWGCLGAPLVIAARASRRETSD